MGIGTASLERALRSVRPPLAPSGVSRSLRRSCALLRRAARPMSPPRAPLAPACLSETRLNNQSWLELAQTRDAWAALAAELMRRPTVCGFASRAHSSEFTVLLSSLLEAWIRAPPRCFRLVVCLASLDRSPPQRTRPFQGSLPADWEYPAPCLDLCNRCSALLESRKDTC